MAKLLDPDDLNVGTEITIDTTAKTFTLVAAGSLVAKDGVTIQAIYSKFIKLWETSTYNKYPFPMDAIDALSGQYVFGTDGQTYNGWKPANDATRQMMRDGGWSEFSAAGALNRVYAGIVSLGDVNSGAQLYYQRLSSDASSNFTFTDEVNEGIQVFGDASNGNFDKKTFFKAYVREYAKKYKDSVLADTGKTATGAYIVNVLLSNEDDLKVVAADGTVAASSPYTKINVKYFGSAYLRDVDTVGTPRSFGIVIDAGTHSGIDGSMSAGGSTLTSAAGGITGADYTGGKVIVRNGANKATYNISGTPTSTVVTISGTFPSLQSGASFTLVPATPLNATLPQIYTKIQYLLRQNSNINTASGSVTGKTASLLLGFVGDALNAGASIPTNPNGGGPGVMVEGLADADVNSITFYDNSAATRIYPYSAAGVMNFNSFLTSGSTGYYRMYFADPTGGAGDAWGESGAVTVNDKDGNPIEGTINSAQIAFSFDYTGNAQGGRTPNTDAPIVLVAGNKGSAKPVVVNATITQSKSVVVTATAAQDRSYVP